MSQLTTFLSGLGGVAKGVLGTVAPTILKAVGGPFGSLAAVALQAVFGTNDPAKVDAALATATPDQLLALRKADDDFKIQMEQLRISEEDLAFKDTADARAMQVATKDPTVGRLAWLVIGGFLLMSCGVVAALFIWPDKGKLLLTGEAGLFFGTLFGYLASEAKQASAFFFGSTAGSQAKDATIADIAKG